MELSADLVKVLIAAAIMVPACISDWRKREASDIYWLMMGGSGIVFLVLADHGTLPLRLSVAAGSALMLYDMTARKDIKPTEQLLIYSATALLMALPAAAGGSGIMAAAVPISATYVLMNVLYYTGLLPGGADAKCLISMGIMFQHYPAMDVFPLIRPAAAMDDAYMLFSVSVLLLALIFAVLPMLIFLLSVNLRRGEKGWMALRAYRMDADKIPGSHVWLVQDVVDGTVVMARGAADDPRALERLTAAGETRIWVTPKIPFLIPIFAGFVFIAVIGNPLFIF